MDPRITQYACISYVHVFDRFLRPVKSPARHGRSARAPACFARGAPRRGRCRAPCSEMATIRWVIFAATSC